VARTPDPPGTPDPPERRAPRLFVYHGLDEGAAFDLDQAQTNYIANVLRLPATPAGLQWPRRGMARLPEPKGRRLLHLIAEARVRPRGLGPDLHYLFAPLKHARLDIWRRRRPKWA
jgi:16S rRNA (uracil1498-N3)-methyltransferase